MSRTLPCINVNDDAIDALRDYFFNNYTGEMFSVILKGKFYINYFNNQGNHAKFLVTQEEEKTTIYPVSSNNKKEPFKLIIHNNKLSYDFENNCYIAKSSLVAYSDINVEVFNEYERCLTDIFSYLVIFFSKEGADVPYSFSFNRKGKQKIKKAIREYNLTKEIVTKKVKFAFLRNEYSYENFNLYCEINTSISFSKKLESLMKKEDKSFIDPLYIPFKNFKFSLDKNITEIICHVNENTKKLECIVFKSKINIFALEISLEKDPNRNFKIYTFDSFNRVENEENISTFSLAKDIIHLMVINFFYFTHYKIIVDKIDRELQPIEQANVAGHNTRSNLAKKETQKNIYLNVNRKVYNIPKSLETCVNRRKRPEYKKFSWQVRGHMRRLASGKVIYIAPYTCNRKNKDNCNEDKKNT